MCRAGLIFERMQYLPQIRKQLKQILTKFNPRLTFDIFILSLKSYPEFSDYDNKRRAK